MMYVWHRPLKDYRPPNNGLVFDKFFEHWSFVRGEVSIRENGKKEWLRYISQLPLLPLHEMGAIADRQTALVNALGGKSWRIRAVSRFVTGLGEASPTENGFSFHHAFGYPYLPGSGLKGALRAFMDASQPLFPESGATSDIDVIFGSPKHGSGDTIFFDVLPVSGVALELDIMTPHYGPWYQSAQPFETPGDWFSPVPIPFLAVAYGAQFQMSIAPRSGDANAAAWQNNAALILRQFREMFEWGGMGAKTAVGYGRFEFVD
jgi:CRISPR-associated protein Cmr6